MKTRPPNPASGIRMQIYKAPMFNLPASNGVLFVRSQLNGHAA
jgi:hypothetical protein